MTARLLARRTVAVTAVLVGLPWLGTVAGNALVGDPTASVGTEGTAPAVAVPTDNTPRAPRVNASRSRSEGPSRPDLKRVGAPARGANLNWAALADCESSGNPRAVSPSGKYRGLYQFDLRTWRSVGGTGDPIDASPAEQTHRAAILHASRGASPWPSCGRLL